MSKKLIIGRYENRLGIQRLRMVGPFSREIIDNIFLPRNPNTRCAVEDGLYGEVSLLVKSEDSCPGLVKELNAELKEKNYKDYNIEYRGVISVHPKELSSLKKPQDLYDLVKERLINESNGEIMPEESEPLDYQKTLEKLTE